MGFKEARKAAGLTMAEAGKRLGVSDAAVAQWESGATMPTARRLVHVAALYGCTIDELIAPDEEGGN
jgi:HTH-type transcriptional regulator/antitoxin HipB